jgi:hypothetical protein
VKEEDERRRAERIVACRDMEKVFTVVPDFEFVFARPQFESRRRYSRLLLTPSIAALDRRKTEK